MTELNLYRVSFDAGTLDYGLILDVSFKATADITDAGLEQVAHTIVSKFIENFDRKNLITDEIVLLETNVQPEQEIN